MLDFEIGIVAFVTEAIIDYDSRFVTALPAKPRKYRHAIRAKEMIEFT